MNIIQKQCLLMYLGYYHGKIDGIAGEKFLDAVICFQDDYRTLKVDGICGEKTEEALIDAVANGIPENKENETEAPSVSDWWSKIEYFKRSEFACKCGEYCGGFPVEPDEKMVRYADAIRKKLNSPLRVNSGIRCNRHNENVGGAKRSQHMLGTACDLGAPEGVSPKEMADIAELVIGNTGGIGIYSWGIHIDSRPVKARWNG